MDNPVVTMAVRAACDAGYAALRFNFGGVGASEGSYGGGTAETADALAALDRTESVVGITLRKLTEHPLSDPPSLFPPRLPRLRGPSQPLPAPTAPAARCV
jgi:hypothetical protein